MKFTWKDDGVQHRGGGMFQDLVVDEVHQSLYFVCVSATPPWASHPGDMDCPSFDDVATAKAWIEAEYMMRESEL